MSSTRYHVGVDVERTLRMSDYQLEGMFEKDGIPLSADAARNELSGMLSRGIKTIPAGQCDNWNEELQRCDGHRHD